MQIPQIKDKHLQTVLKMIAKARYFHRYFMVFLSFSAHHFCSRAQGRAKAPPKPRSARSAPLGVLARSVVEARTWSLKEPISGSYSYRSKFETMDLINF